MIRALLHAILLVALSAPFISKADASPIVAQDLDRKPLAFTTNIGQWNEQVQYRTSSGGATIWICTDKVVYQFLRAVKDSSESGGFTGFPDNPTDRFSGEMDSIEQLIITAKFVGANPNVEVVGEDIMEYKCNYFLGNEPNKWYTDVPNYEAITLRDIYPGIDLKFSGDGNNQAAYEFVVAPGADVAQVKVEYDGAESTSIGSDGRMTLSTKWGDLVAALDSGNRSNRLGLPIFKANFRNDAGDQLPYQLNVATVQMSWSTYLGSVGEERALDIAVDASGNSYLIGFTYSSAFPTENPYQTFSGIQDVFVTKLSRSGSGLIYSTYLGGANQDGGYGIVVDDNGNAFVTGFTLSTDFPIYNPYQAAFQGDSYDAFVTKLSSLGNTLIYSTYLGGTSYDVSNDIAVDNSGSAYITGSTNSINFPVLNPLQTLQGSEDAFVSKLSASGSSLAYSTYLGGNGYDTGNGIVVDGSGNAYLTGRTSSSDFPTQNPNQTLLGVEDAFVTKLATSGNSLIYSTFLGGSSNEYGRSICVDEATCAYVTGVTSSIDFPMQGPFQETYGGGSQDAFVTKFSVSGTALLYSTFLGGDALEEGTSIVVSEAGSAYVTGWTLSSNFPIRAPTQGSFGGVEDAYVAIISGNGNALEFSTYLGGSDVERALGIALDNDGGFYTIGRSMSNDFPTLNGYQSFNAGGNDVFVTKMIVGVPTPHISLEPTSLTFVAPQNGDIPTTQTLTLTNSAAGTLDWYIDEQIDWLDISPYFGTGDNQQITVSVNTSNKLPGTYTGTLYITSNNADNSPQTVLVTYIVPEIVPVVLVHGWTGGPAIWGGPGSGMVSWLLADVSPLVWPVQLYPCGHPDEGNFDGKEATFRYLYRGNAEILSNEIQLKLSSLSTSVRNRISRMDIVAHSMGGLVARRYISTTSGDSWVASKIPVRNLIMLGSPNEGTNLGGWEANAQQLVLGGDCFGGPATRELTETAMKIFNDKFRDDGTTVYRVVAGRGGLISQTGPFFIPNLYCYKGLGALVSGKPNDGVVSVRSVGGSGKYLGVVIDDCHNEYPSDYALYTDFIRPTLGGTLARPMIAPLDQMPDQTSHITYQHEESVQLGAFTTDSFMMESNAGAAIYLVTTDSMATFHLTTPMGSMLDSTATEPDSSVVFFSDSRAIKGFWIESAASGNWSWTVHSNTAKSGPVYFCVYVAVSSAIEMVLSQNAEFLAVGDSLLLQVRLVDGSFPLTGATVVADVIHEKTDTLGTVVFYDDGGSADALADDGIYGAIAPASVTGLMSYNVHATGLSSSGQFSRLGAFYAYLPSAHCGDADGSGIITISDAVYLINYIFAGGPAPNPVLAGDADCNGIITISDAVYLINYIFGGGAAPCAACP